MKIRKPFVVGVAALVLIAAQARADSSTKATIDDSMIHAKIDAALIADSLTKARQIDVEISKGVVQLNGVVDSEAAKNRATELAKGVAGVREVHNNLQVSNASRATETVVSDSMITTKVKAALIGDKTTKAYQIDVSTRDGVVQLSGFVDSAVAKTEAERLARTVKGVREIRNDLEVRG
jgi:hyperosmotically inducible protein